MKSVFPVVMFLISSNLIAELPVNKQDSVSAVSIKEIMESVITPATNTLWEFEQPSSDEDWQRLEDAAINMVAAGALINSGGTGSNDNNWAEDPVWRGFVEVMTDASLDALKAIRNKDFETFFEASDSIYPPCEGCHLRFNPGVINQ